MNTRVPRIARVAVMRVEPFGPVRELVHVELAEHDGARARQTRHDRRIPRGYGIGEDLRAAGRADALGRVEVLRRPGHTVQRSGDLTGYQVGLGGARRLQRGVGGDRDERANLGVERRDALEVRPDDLDRRDFLGGDHPPEVGHRRPDEIGHQSTRYCVVGSRSSRGRLSSRASESSSRSTAGRIGSSSASVHANPPAAAIRFMPSSPISMGASIPLECEAMAVALTILHDFGGAPSRRTLSVSPGTTILKAAHAGGVDLTATCGLIGSSSASVHANPPAAAIRFMPSSPISMGASIPLECEAMAVALTILHDFGAAPSRRTLSVSPGTTILKAAHAGGVDVTATCG